MLLVCCDCTTAYSVGASRCPQCGSTNAVEQGSPEHETWLAAREAKTKGRKNSTPGTSDAAG